MTQLHPASIYARHGDGRFYSPFTARVHAMERLLLVNFEGGKHYRGFEPQVFDDAINGTGLAVIAYRLDGYVDVYHQDGVTVDVENFNVEKGLGDCLRTDFEAARFDIQPNGLDVHVKFTDKAGRPIEIRIREAMTRPRRPIDMLAPAGTSIEQPTFLPLFYMHDFYFVRKAGTELVITVDGEPYQPSSLPAPIDWQMMYLLRYCGSPFIVILNETYDGPLDALTPNASGEVQDGPITYMLREQDGHYEIAVLHIANDRHFSRLTLTPPLPDLAALKDGTSLTGSITITADGPIGRVTGDYAVTRDGQAVTVTLTPSGGWQPNERKLSVNLMYRLIAMFRTWPKSYQWTGTLDLSGEGVMYHSGWARTAQTEVAKMFKG